MHGSDGNRKFGRIATLQNLSMAPVLKEITVSFREEQCDKVLHYMVPIISDVKVQRRGKLIGTKMRNVSWKEKGRQTALKVVRRKKNVHEGEQK